MHELSVLPTRIRMRWPACSFVVQLTRLWFGGDCRAALSCIRKQARSGDVEVPPQRRIGGSDQEVRVGLVQVSVLAVPGIGGVRIRQAGSSWGCRALTAGMC